MSATFFASARGLSSPEPRARTGSSLPRVGGRRLCLRCASAPLLKGMHPVRESVALYVYDTTHVIVGSSPRSGGWERSCAFCRVFFLRKFNLKPSHGGVHYGNFRGLRCVG